MSESIATATAAPDMITVGIGDQAKTLRMAPLHLKAMGEYERFIQRRTMRAAVDIPADRPDLMDSLIKQLASVGYFSEEAVEAQFRTIDGQTMITWLGVNIAHPEITFDWFQQNIQMNQLRDAISVHRRLNYPPSARSKKSEAAA